MCEPPHRQTPLARSQIQLFAKLAQADCWLAGAALAGCFGCPTVRQILQYLAQQRAGLAAPYFGLALECRQQVGKQRSAAAQGMETWFAQASTSG